MSAANDDLPPQPLEVIIAAAVKRELDALGVRLVAPIGLYPRRYALVNVASLVIGYTEKALNKKMDDGVLIEGVHWFKAPDGRRFLDFEAFEEWVAPGRGKGSHG